MSTPDDSVAPAPPTGSSNPWSLVQWWKRICDWIAALSPSGASEYDTGWVSITPAAGLSTIGSGAAVRRIGRVVYYRGGLSGVSLSTSGTVVGTVPAGFRAVTGIDGSASAVGLGSGAVARATVSSSGDILIIPPSNQTASVYLKGLSGYLVD